jgi:hypothetical protein
MQSKKRRSRRMKELVSRVSIADGRSLLASCRLAWPFDAGYYGC